MDKLQHAKALLVRHTRSAVLFIMAVAAALSANAAPILPSGNFQCLASGEMSCTGGAAPLPANSGPVQGVKQWLDGTVLGATGEGQLGWVTFSTSGALNEGIAAGTTIPISFQLSVNGSTGSPATDWYIFLQLVRGGTTIGSVETGGPVGGFQTGSMNLVTTAALNPGDVIHLETTIGGVSEDGLLSVQVPQNSVDWSATSTPEPSTLLLFSLGIGLAGAGRFRRS
ncbi:MAG: PEP-CTERM sorting domain-containing protein [Acidobacteria bacterium]|nr:PEP-CTERM sorting domain-containing protein [Acidobacteriota bacterium]